jgi:hypothetical protein
MAAVRFRRSQAAANRAEAEGTVKALGTYHPSMPRAAPDLRIEVASGGVTLWSQYRAATN